MSQEGCHSTEAKVSAEPNRERVAMMDVRGRQPQPIAAELGRPCGSETGYLFQEPAQVVFGNGRFSDEGAAVSSLERGLA